MFAAILDVDGGFGEAAVGRLRQSDCHDVEIAGGSRRVALVVPKVEAAFDGEWRGIDRLGDRLWIVGRIRLDGRQTLRARLGAPQDLQAPSDATLCLQAYVAWGEGFLEFLAGDFCFALWDEARGALICARDQLGVRTLFHAAAGRHRFVSDSIDWIASQPAMDLALDDHWIADFLCIGRSLDFDRTAYRGIGRVPPAHVLTLSGETRAQRRYWRLDIAEPIHYRDRRLYAERFRELVAAAVADRLPSSGKVGISMSGGLDSTSLAAFAVAATGDPARVVAECVHYERLMVDDEPHFSSLVARHLGIDLRLRAVDDLTFDPQWRTRAIRTPEPSLSIVSAHCDRLIMGEMAAAAPLWLYGEGPDNAFHFERNAYLSWLARRGDWVRLAGAFLLYLQSKGLASWPATVRRYARPSAEVPDVVGIPEWLDPELARRLDLEGRLRDANDMAAPFHGWHPKAIGSFENVIWQRLFGERAYEEALAPMAWRHPFLDLRVLEFMLSVPPVPWAREKLLMREAMQGRLPREVLRRKKSPLAASPIAEPIRLKGLGDLPPGDRLGGYVDIARLPTAASSHAALDHMIAVHALDYWMMYNRRGAGNGGSDSA